MIEVRMNTYLKRFFSSDLTITLLLIIGSFLFYQFKAASVPFWYDELFTVFWTQHERIEDVRWVSYWDIAPPGFNIVMHYWNSVFGITESAVRGLSNLCMSIALGFMFLFTKRFFDTKMAAIVVALFITNSLLYFYSNEARCYAFILMLSIFSNFIFAKMILDPKWYWAALLGVVNYYLCYTHYVTVNLIVIQGLFAVFLFRKRLFLWYVLSFIPFYWLMRPFMSRMLDIVTKKQEMNLEKPTLDAMLNFSSAYFNNMYFGLLLCFLLTVGVVIYARKRSEEIGKKQDFVFLFLVCSGLGYIFLTLIMALTKSPIFIYRYMIPSVPGVLILFAFFISKVGSWRNVGIIFAVIVIIGFCTINLNIYKGTNLKRQMEFARKNSSSRVAVISDDIYAFYYYDRALFKHVKNFNQAAATRNVFRVNEPGQLSGFNYWQYDTIIVVANWPYTNESLKGRIMKHFPKCEQFKYTWDGTYTFLYHR
jgi:uncharacterized membrane protein